MSSLYNDLGNDSEKKEVSIVLSNSGYQINKYKKPFFKRIFSKKTAIGILGLSVIFFSLVGFIETSRYVGREVVKIINNTSEKEKFERYILPVLMFDPVPFDDVVKADQFSLLRSAIWAAFMDNGKQKYLNEEYDSFVVPASDVDVSLSMLYGDKIKIKHQTFGDGFMTTYIYDEETNSYTVPIMDQIGIYSPKVITIEHNKDVYKLNVGYIRPDDIWQMYMDDKKKKTKPEKYMEYVLKKTNVGYNILAIRDSDLNSLKEKNYENQLK